MQNYILLEKIFGERFVYKNILYFGNSHASGNLNNRLYQYLINSAIFSFFYLQKKKSSPFVPKIYSPNVNSIRILFHIKYTHTCLFWHFYVVCICLLFNGDLKEEYIVNVVN